MRKGYGIGQGKGYYNLMPMDSHIHSLSAKGVKTGYNPKEKPYKPFDMSKEGKLQRQERLFDRWMKRHEDMKGVTVYLDKDPDSGEYYVIAERQEDGGMVDEIAFGKKLPSFVEKWFADEIFAKGEYTIEKDGSKFYVMKDGKKLSKGFDDQLQAFTEFKEMKREGVLDAKGRKLAKGLRYIKPYKELKEYVERTQPAGVTIERAVQDVYTGAEVLLLKSPRGTYAVMFSSGDVTEPFKTFKEANEYFMDFVSVEGEIL